MTVSLIIGKLIGLGVAIFICVALLSVLFSTAKIILALYYSLIKRTVLLWAMWRKLNRSPAQNLRYDQIEGRGQNTALATQYSVLSFKESLELSKKDYSILFSITFVMLVLFVGFIAFAAFLPKSAIFLHNHAPLLLYVIDFMMKLLLWVWACIVITLPIVLILHNLLLLWREKNSEEMRNICLSRE